MSKGFKKKKIQGFIAVSLLGKLWLTSRLVTRTGSEQNTDKAKQDKK